MMTQGDKREYILLIVLLVFLGIVLVATTIRGPFTIDEINYMVTAIGLREGKLTVPGTEGLGPSKELFSFDPESYGRVAARTPVASLAPPLYAPFALPFLVLGWHGLVLLNTLSYLLTGLIVFVLSKHYAVDRQTPWLAAALVLIGGYGIEYAQGVWPHMFSVFLVTCALYVASKIWQGGKPTVAVLCGLLMGIAIGVREQNIVLTGCLGLTVLLFARRRILATAWYGIGTLLPLVVIATMNLSRDHLWHPFPKFVAYSNQLKQHVGAGSILEPLRVFWARFIDFSMHPEITYLVQADMYKQNPASGAYLVYGTVKKAFLQSCPWIGLAFVVLVLAWFWKDSRKEDVRRSLRGLSLLIFPLVVLFSMAGASRVDGLAYNQRYFLEMIPLAALAVALALDGLSLSVVHMVIGFLAGGIAFAAALMLPSHTLYEIALMRVPLLVAVLLLLSWIFRWHSSARLLLPMTLGLCLGWSLFVHTLDDLPASRNRRMRTATELKMLEEVIPAHSAVFAYWGSKDAAGPLLLTRDVVILDAGADEGADAVRLTKELQRQHRRIFILWYSVPAPYTRGIVGADSLALARGGPFPIYEVLQKNPAGAQ